MQNKKGMVSLELMQWLTKILFLVIVIFTIVFLVRMYIDTENGFIYPKRTKDIIATHLWGLCTEIDRIKEIYDNA